MFSLDAQQSEKLVRWLDEQDAQALERQRKTLPASEFDQLTMGGKYPYTGASGGSLTYSFTPTSLGTVVKVTHGLTQECIDLTDYDMW